MTTPNRAALYTPKASAEILTACTRYADHASLRVVTIIDEDVLGPTPLAGQNLDRLLGRLAAGEFEVVVAHAGEGRLITLSSGTNEGLQPNADLLRCAIYVRCASFSQVRPDPPSNQSSACEAYAARKGWETIATYSDIAASGLKASRLGLEALMTQARQGSFEALLVESLDRLSRDPTHLLSLLMELKSLGVSVHTINGPVNPSLMLPGTAS